MVKVEKLSQEEIKTRGIDSWPIWEKEVSTFPWTYAENEACLILEGEVVVSYDGSEIVIKAGDYVEFSKGLSCIWDISKAIRKHYKFF